MKVGAFIPCRKHNVRWGLVLAAASLFYSAWAHAAVFPIATNSSAVESAFSVASDGTDYLVGILSSTNVTAQLISPSGALLGPPLTVGAGQGSPLVAFGNTKYLVVWAEDSDQSGVDLLGQFVSPIGAKVGSAFALLADAGFHGFQTPQAIASDGTNFLLVWSDEVNILYGQIIGPGGTVLTSEIQFSGSPAGRAGAAFDGINYLVAFQYQTSDSPEQWNTYGTFVSPSGAAGISFLISATPSASSDSRVAVAFGRTNYFVAWARDGGLGLPNPASWDIYGRFVDASGSLVGNELALVGDAGDQRFPGLAFDGANYLLCWSDAFDTTNSNINFEFLDEAGQPIGSQFTVFPTQGTNHPSVGSVLFDGRKYAMVATVGVPGSTSADVYGAFIPSSTASPRLEALRPSTNELFRFRLNGTPGICYGIQWTTNFETLCYFCVNEPCPCIVRGINWATIFTTNAPSESFDVIDPDSTNFTYRVYRAVKQ